MLRNFLDDNRGFVIVEKEGSDSNPHIVSYELNRLYEYWHSIRRSRPMPSRDDLEPSDIKDILPSLFMVDVDKGPVRFRYRLIGTYVAELTGRDMTGQPIDETTYGETAGFVASLFERAVQRRAPMLVRGNAKWLSSSSWKTMAVLFVPLSHDGETVDIVLGCLNSDRRAHAQPESNQLLSVSDVEIIMKPHVAGPSGRRA